MTGRAVDADQLAGRAAAALEQADAHVDVAVGIDDGRAEHLAADMDLAQLPAVGSEEVQELVAAGHHDRVVRPGAAPS